MNKTVDAMLNERAAELRKTLTWMRDQIEVTEAALLRQRVEIAETEAKLADIEAAMSDRIAA